MSAVYKFSSIVMNSACKELSQEHVCTLQNATKCNLSNVEQQNLELHGFCGTLPANSSFSRKSVFLQSAIVTILTSFCRFLTFFLLLIMIRFCWGRSHSLSFKLKLNALTVQQWCCFYEKHLYKINNVNYELEPRNLFCNFRNLFTHVI